MSRLLFNGKYYTVEALKKQHKTELKEATEAYYYKKRLFVLYPWKDTNGNILQTIYASYPKGYYDIGYHIETITSWMSAKEMGIKIL